MTINLTKSKLEFLVRFFKSIFHKKKLTIFIGSKGTTLTAYRFKKTKESIYITNNDKLLKEKYHKFLKKYKSYYITLILDNNECTFKHEIMPILRPLIKSNPIERFITENYNSSDIVGYYTYEVENKENEIWNNCIASTPFISPISDMLQYIISNAFKYNGTYFLSLEFYNIIDKILLKTKYQKYKNELQIFATITKSSDIRIVVKHKQNILDEQKIECPTENKSILLGTIAHIITEKLLFYKEYIKVQNLKICVILLVGKDLKKDARKLTFQDAQLIIPNEDAYKNDEFQDHILMDKFDESDAHIAFNPDLKLITKLTLIDKIIFKPLILILISLALIVVILKSQSLIIQSETDTSNKEYYSLSKKYREVDSLPPEGGSSSLRLEAD